MTNTPEKPKISAEEAGMDKFKAALEKIPPGKKFKDVKDDLRTPFCTDVVVELGIDEQKAIELYEKASIELNKSDKWREILQKKANESGEKTELDKFIAEIENYDLIKKAIESKGSDGIIMGLIRTVEKKWNESKWGKQIKWSVLAAWIGNVLIGFAKAGMAKLKKLEEKDGFSWKSTWQAPIYSKIKTIGEWLLPNEAQITKLALEVKQAFKAKQYDVAKVKAHKLLELDPDNQVAKSTLKKIEALQPKAAVPEAKKYEKDMAELKSVLDSKTRGIPFETFDKTAYENVLKSFSNDPAKLKARAEELLSEKKPIRLIFDKIEVHPNKNLKKNFKFKIEDLTIPDPKLKHIEKAVAGKDNLYEIHNLKQMDVDALRKFMEAVRKESGLSTYEKSAKRGKPAKRGK